VRRALSVLALAGLVAVPAGSAPGGARAFLTEAFGLSEADIARVDRGEIVGRTLPVRNTREVATLGVVRILTTPERYVEQLRDIVRFKRTDDILQIGTFSEPPRASDLAPLTIEDADLQRFRECRVGDCDVRYTADGVRRLQQGVDWRAQDAARKAEGLVKQLLVDYVTAYRASGAAAAIEYVGRPMPLNVGREFASLVDADASTWTYVPSLRRHLLQYPATAGDGGSDFIYWSKERVHARPVVSITHVAIVPGEPASPVSVAIGSKQLYAAHYFDASLGVTLLVRDTAASSPAIYVVYLNRSRIDLFDGLFGGMARRVVAGRARSLVTEQLGRLQRDFAAG
jgi:hypothetical protein